MGPRTAGVEGGIYPSVRPLPLGLRPELGRVPGRHPEVPNRRLYPLRLLALGTMLSDQVIVPSGSLPLPQLLDGSDVHARLSLV